MGINERTVTCSRCGRLCATDPYREGYPAPHLCNGGASEPVNIKESGKSLTHDRMDLRVTDFIQVSNDVYVELMRSCGKHPWYPKDPLRRAAIMVEEAGESMKEAIDLTVTDDRGYSPLTSTDFQACRDRLRKELVQTAAMAIKAIIAMKREDGRNEFE